MKIPTNDSTGCRFLTHCGRFVGDEPDRRSCGYGTPHFVVAFGAGGAVAASSSFRAIAGVR